MRWRSSPDEDSIRAWFAGLLACAVTLIAVAILALLGSASAGARPVASAAPALAAGQGPVGDALTPIGAAVAPAPEAEAEDAEEPEGPGGEAEEAEAAEDEGWEDEEGDVESEPPGDCVLESARARALASEDSPTLRLKIAYTASEPAAVELELKLRGGKGALNLGRKRLGIGYEGVLHASERLGEGELAKALAARELTVRLRVLGTPGYCRGYFSQRLRDRSGAADTASWR